MNSVAMAIPTMDKVIPALICFVSGGCIKSCVYPGGAVAAGKSASLVVDIVVALVQRATPSKVWV